MWPRTLTFSSGSGPAAKQVRIMNKRYAVVMAPLVGASLRYGASAPPVIREQMTASILAGLARDLEPTRRPDTIRKEAQSASD